METRKDAKWADAVQYRGGGGAHLRDEFVESWRFELSYKQCFRAVLIRYVFQHYNVATLS